MHVNAHSYVIDINLAFSTCYQFPVCELLYVDNNGGLAERYFVHHIDDILHRYTRSSLAFPFHLTFMHSNCVLSEYGIFVGGNHGACHYGQSVSEVS